MAGTPEFAATMVVDMTGPGGAVVNVSTVVDLTDPAADEVVDLTDPAADEVVDLTAPEAAAVVDLTLGTGGVLDLTGEEVAARPGSFHGDCDICMAPSTATDPFVVLRCGHSFHYGCIAAWSAESPYLIFHCPVCRAVSTEESLHELRG
jgi:Rieske Fe-S protein